jgi:hypothetical protein
MERAVADVIFSHYTRRLATGRTLAMVTRSKQLPFQQIWRISKRLKAAGRTK